MLLALIWSHPWHWYTSLPAQFQYMYHLSSHTHLQFNVCFVFIFISAIMPWISHQNICILWQSFCKAKDFILCCFLLSFIRCLVSFLAHNTFTQAQTRTTTEGKKINKHPRYINLLSHSHTYGCLSLGGASKVWRHW